MEVIDEIIIMAVKSEVAIFINLVVVSTIHTINVEPMAGESIIDVINGEHLVDSSDATNRTAEVVKISEDVPEMGDPNSVEAMLVMNGVTD